jgi:hypothetical protein
MWYESRHACEEFVRGARGWDGDVFDAWTIVVCRPQAEHRPPDTRVRTLVVILFVCFYQHGTSEDRHVARDVTTRGSIDTLDRAHTRLRCEDCVTVHTDT